MGSALSANASAFLALKSREDLAAWLGITDRRLRFLLYVVGPSKNYISFEIKKKGGGVRLIDSPSPAMKKIQHKLLEIFTELAIPSSIAKGYVRGFSTIDHAYLHRRRRHIILADLESFFPTITFQRVRGALLAKPFVLEAKVATCVAQLCCKDGSLPQGAPTSPVLSNLICRALDRKILWLANRHRFTVSRYADDICFSSNKRDIPSSLVSYVDGDIIPGQALVSAVQSSGFSLNVKKFKVKERNSQQLVTGLVVNDGTALPRKWRRQLRTLLHILKNNSIEKATEIVSIWTSPPASRKGFHSIEQLIRGKTYFAQHVDKRCDRKFSESIFRCYASLRNFMPRPLNGFKFRVLAEGKTDLLHLDAACKWFQSQGEFTDLNPRFANFHGEIGDVELMKTLERIAKSDIPELAIGIFDCDNDKFMKQEGLSPGCFRQVGSSVYALCLAAPHSHTEDIFCIELLYDIKDLLSITQDGRKLFLPREFDPVSGISLDGIYKRQYPKANAVIVSDTVTRISDGFSALLSKNDFAEMIERASPPFESVNFNGFRESFNALRRVVDEYLLKYR